jgi:4-hydroxybenzoate polyprenyltransferase
MYLNDAFDAQFDMQHRPERPIPSGAIRPGMVWLLGFLCLAAGLGGAAVLGRLPLACAVLLSAAILVYDAVHKIFAFSPLLMALCRFLLLLLAAAVGWKGVTGLAVWSGLVLAVYIVGLSYIARQESVRVLLRYWPCLLLLAPILLAWIVNRGDNHSRALFISGTLAIWILRCLSFAYASSQRNLGRCVSGLLAAIPLVDWLSIWTGDPVVAAVFIGLFVLALLFQRVIPAT